MKPSELLREALESFGPEGERWLQGDWSSLDGQRFCSVGAVVKTRHRSIGRHEGCDRWSLYLDRAAKRVRPDLPACAITLNDDSSTTFEDVALMFKHAIALAEADER